MKRRPSASIVYQSFPLLLLVFVATTFAGTSVYKLDFGTPTSPVAEGFQAGEAPLLQETIDPSFSMTDDKGGRPIGIDFKGAVGGFSLGIEGNPNGNPEKPLTTDYLYTFGTKPEEPTNIGVLITGLTPGSLVTLYAIGAANGDGRAGFVSLGDSGLVDIKGGIEPALNTSSIDSFTLVAAKLKVGADGRMAGVLSNSDGSQSRPEAQLAGIILVVEAL